MPQEKLLINNITNLTTKTKGEGDLTTSFRFDAKVPVSTLTKLLSLQAQGGPLIIAFSSLQATLGLPDEEDSEN